MAVCLEMKGLRKVYKKGTLDVEALQGVDLVIERGEFVSIMGPSGSGKTTLLNIIGCLDVPTSGTVVYDGTPLQNLKENDLSEYRKNNVGFIFQSYNLIPVLTVQENVELPMVIDKSVSQIEREKRARRLIERVGLKGMEHRYPRELSGGQEQRVAIARALVKQPLVVLADEPTANLDSKTAEEVIEIMRQMNEAEGTTFVFSTHDPRVEKHARRIIILQDGRIAQDERK